MANLDVNPGLQRSVLFDRILVIAYKQLQIQWCWYQKTAEKLYAVQLYTNNETHFILLEFLWKIHPIHIKASNFKIFVAVVEE